MGNCFYTKAKNVDMDTELNDFYREHKFCDNLEENQFELRTKIG